MSGYNMTPFHCPECNKRLYSKGHDQKLLCKECNQYFSLEAIIEEQKDLGIIF